jgi:Fe-S cluster assembly protein SufB
MPLTKQKYKYGFKDDIEYVFQTEKGLSEKVIRDISKMKKEPEWMLNFRLKGLKAFREKPMPNWGPDLSSLNFDDIIYYAKASEKVVRWEDVPEKIKTTFEKIGIPEAERKYLAGVSNQYESEVIYHNLKKNLEKKGVIFTDLDEAVQKYPDIVKKHIGKVVPIADNKFAALNSAAWSGGSFVYVPEGVNVGMPLQAYFRINAPNIGQFEKTLIIAEKNSKVHYIEGCSAPVYSTDSLHAAVVEVIAEEGAEVRYTTVQNWSNNVYNLVTKRAFAKKNASVEWVDCNMGSGITMKYPTIFLLGEGARAEVLSIAFAGDGQILDSGSRIFHNAKNTYSNIISKSISKGIGRTVFRGSVYVSKGCTGVKSMMNCDSLLLDKESSTETIPKLDINENDVSVGHEATAGKINEDQLFYLMSRGIKKEEAISMIVRGFMEPVSKELPLEFAVEMNRLIDLEMEGSVG